MSTIDEAVMELVSSGAQLKPDGSGTRWWLGNRDLGIRTLAALETLRGLQRLEHHTREQGEARFHRPIVDIELELPNS